MMTPSSTALAVKAAIANRKGTKDPTVTATVVSGKPVRGLKNPKVSSAVMTGRTPTAKQVWVRGG